MKILFLTNKNPFCDLSAGANRSLGLLKELHNHGYNVTVFITGGYYNHNEYELFKKEGTKGGIKYIYLSKKKNITIWDRRISEYLTDKFEWIALRRKFKKYKKSTNQRTVVWIGDSIVNFKILKNKTKNSNTKYFMELNEYPDIHLHNNSNNYIWQKWSANKKNKILFKNIIPHLDGLALMTNNLINYYTDKVSSNTRLLHLPMTVDLERFALDTNHQPLKGLHKPYIAFIGSMNNKKDGVNILIEAFANIAKHYKDVNLCIYGYWTYDTPAHQKRIKELGLENRIIYSKPIESNQICRLIMNAEILALPRPASNQAEGGFPTKLGEYLATTNPVVATRVGEIPEYLHDKESVFFCNPDSIDSLTTGLKCVLDNKEKAKNVGLEGRKVAESVFSTRVQGKRLDAYFKNLF